MCSLCSLLIIMIVLPGTSGKDTVSQDPPELTVQERQTVILNCSYSTTSGAPTLFWYIQYPGDAPRYLLKRYNAEKGEKSSDFPDRFSANLDKAKKTVPLNITGALVSDSAVYLCAMHRYGSGTKLTFGSGTKLSVEPKRDVILEPSVYILPPPKHTTQPVVSAVCLVTDFFPNNLTVSLTAGGNAQNRTPEDAMVSIEDKSYSLVGYLTGPKSELEEGFQCNVLNEPKPRKLKALDDSAVPCIEVQDDEETDEHMNLLSLTVLSLRIIFFKSIAFNLLMTVRAWIS